MHRNSLKAQKCLFDTKCADHIKVRKLQLSSAHLLLSDCISPIFNTFEGSRWLKILPKNFFPRLAIIVQVYLCSGYDDPYQPTVNQGHHSHRHTT